MKDVLPSGDERGRKLRDIAHDFEVDCMRFGGITLGFAQRLPNKFETLIATPLPETQDRRAVHNHGLVWPVAPVESESDPVAAAQ